eukprot:TRINITY_DN11372_c0_g1_i1.p1 TRINITY_DN11372_c0_g1~~TRINITY_DN11372_c0_g1_i1.p1  ORF type:complete len:541 (-),score=7.70 TRINITY_DN11372_c0_g1_i1:971-2593(-)
MSVETGKRRNGDIGSSTNIGSIDFSEATINENKSVKFKVANPGPGDLRIQEVFISDATVTAPKSKSYSDSRGSPAATATKLLPPGSGSNGNRFDRTRQPRLRTRAAAFLIERLPPLPLVLQVGEQWQCEVAFCPVDAGTFSAVLNIVPALPHPRQQITLFGEGGRAVSLELQRIPRQMLLNESSASRLGDLDGERASWDESLLRPDDESNASGVGVDTSRAALGESSFGDNFEHLQRSSGLNSMSSIPPTNLDVDRLHKPLADRLRPAVLLTSQDDRWEAEHPDSHRKFANVTAPALPAPTLHLSSIHQHTEERAFAGAELAACVTNDENSASKLLELELRIAKLEQIVVGLAVSPSSDNTNLSHQSFHGGSSTYNSRGFSSAMDRFGSVEPSVKVPDLTPEDMAFLRELEDDESTSKQSSREDSSHWRTYITASKPFSPGLDRLTDTFSRDLSDAPSTPQVLGMYRQPNVNSPFWRSPQNRSWPATPGNVGNSKRPIVTPLSKSRAGPAGQHATAVTPLAKPTEALRRPTQQQCIGRGR